MADRLFGWDLPPGVTSSMIEDQVMPITCEECEIYDEKLGTCPYMGNENWCYKLSLVKECANCKKKLCKVEGAFTKEEIVIGYELHFCCSKKCSEELQNKLQEEIDILSGGKGR